MNNLFGGLFKDWMNTQTAGSRDSLWRFLVKKNPWIFAHHPADSCFREHVWQFQGLYFCKGCVMTVSGWFLACGVQLATGWLNHFTIPWLTLIFVGMLIPSVITALLGAPRIIKHLSRLLLGVLMGSAVWLFIVTDWWWVRGVLLAVYFTVKYPLDHYRRRKNESHLRAHSSTNKHDLHKNSVGRSSRTRHSH